MTDCWQVLGIEPTTDTRAIKRAYSALLHCTRPEDDPEGFQIVRAAYVQAKQLAALDGANHADSLSHTSIDESREEDYVEPGEEFLESDFLTSSQLEEIEQVMDRLYQLQKGMRVVLPNAWAFLEVHPSLTEEPFRRELGQRLLDFIDEIESNHKQTRRSHRLLPGGLLARLNAVFLWTYRPHEFVWPSHHGLWGELVEKMEEAPKFDRSEQPMGGRFVPNYPKPATNFPKAKRELNWADLSSSLGYVMVMVLIFIVQCSTQ